MRISGKEQRPTPAGFTCVLVTKRLERGASRGVVRQTAVFQKSIGLEEKRRGEREIRKERE